MQDGVARVVTLTCQSLQGHTDTYASPANLLRALCCLHRLHSAARRLLHQFGLGTSIVTGQFTAGDTLNDSSWLHCSASYSKHKRQPGKRGCWVRASIIRTALLSFVPPAGAVEQGVSALASSVPEACLASLGAPDARQSLDTMTLALALGDVPGYFKGLWGLCVPAATK
jgi:hypothetical protein